MEYLRAFWSFIGGLFLTVMYPLFNPLIILVMLFCFDVLGGIICDSVLNSTGFSFRKFLNALWSLILYSASIAAMYLICYLQNDLEEGKILLKTITYVCSYFYSVNIFKNLKASYPGARFFSFLHFVLSLEVVTNRIPELKLFLMREKELASSLKYKGKNGVVEAIQLTADRGKLKEVLNLIGKTIDIESEEGKKIFEEFHKKILEQGSLTVKRSGSLLLCPIGDFIVKDNTGIVYSLKAEIFNKNYRKL